MSAKYSHSCPSLVTVQQQPCLRQTSMLPTCRRKPSTLQINTSKGTLTRQHAQANVWHQWLLVGEWREWWEFPVGLISLVWLRAGQWVSIPIIFHTLTYEETRSTQVLIKRVIEREMFLSTHIHTHTHTHTHTGVSFDREGAEEAKRRLPEGELEQAKTAAAVGKQVTSNAICDVALSFLSMREWFSPPVEFLLIPLNVE